MSLDKWLKSEDGEKKAGKKKVPSIQVKESKLEVKEKNVGKKPSIRLKKYSLVCTNTKCKYQKTIMKKILAARDNICPRCNKKMKVKEL